MPEWLLWPRALPRGRVPLRARPPRRGLLEGPLPKLVLRHGTHRVGQVRVRRWGSCFDRSSRTCPMQCAGYARHKGIPDATMSSKIDGAASIKALVAATPPRGACVNGTCVCAAGWAGHDCGEMACPGENGLLCSGHGACDAIKGLCVCADGWAGDACERVACGTHKCLNGGQCVHDRCFCNDGWTGPNCGQRYVHTAAAHSTACPC